MPDELYKSNDIALESVGGLIDQCYEAWHESIKISLPELYKEVKNLVVCGMGGSNLPIHIIKSVFEIKLPLSVSEGYTLPNWANEQTLVILSSYSGDTEETLSCADQAVKNKCKVIGITSGGKLKDFLVKGNYPFYCFNPIYNPSKLPRYGIGYGIFGLLGLLSTLNLIAKYTQTDLEKQLTTAIKNLSNSLNGINKSVDEIVKQVKGFPIAIFSGEHLKGNGRTLTNQLNETSKNLSFFVYLPDADHNFIEGFSKLQFSIASIFIESENYLKTHERFSITKEIISNNGYKTFSYKVSKGELMQEMLETLIFSSFFSVRLAMENRVDPLAIPTIDLIKSKMSLTTVK